MNTQLDINEFVNVYPELESIQEKLKDWFEAHPNDDITLIVPNPHRKREIKLNYIPAVEENKPE